MATAVPTIGASLLDSLSNRAVNEGINVFPAEHSSLAPVRLYHAPPETDWLSLAYQYASHNDTASVWLMVVGDLEWISQNDDVFYYSYDPTILSRIHIHHVYEIRQVLQFLFRASTMASSVILLVNVEHLFPSSNHLTQEQLRQATQIGAVLFDTVNALARNTTDSPTSIVVQRNTNQPSPWESIWSQWWPPNQESIVHLPEYRNDPKHESCTVSLL